MGSENSEKLYSKIREKFLITTNMSVVLISYEKGIIKGNSRFTVNRVTYPKHLIM